jgi:hypothetical protein
MSDGEWRSNSSFCHLSPYIEETQRYGSRNGSSARTAAPSATAPRTQKSRSRLSSARRTSSSTPVSTSGSSAMMNHEMHDSAFMKNATPSHAARFQLLSRAKSTKASIRSGIHPAQR